MVKFKAESSLGTQKICQEFAKNATSWTKSNKKFQARLSARMRFIDTMRIETRTSIRSN